MRKEFEGKITVYRILDSRREKFNLSKAYEDKVDVKNVITAPEIEKLIICNEGKIKEYERELKPSTYCKTFLKYADVKSYDFVTEYFSDINVLLNAVYEYRRISKVKENEVTLWGLLKEDVKKKYEGKR